jgi:hypothetical protein
MQFGEHPSVLPIFLFLTSWIFYYKLVHFPATLTHMSVSSIGSQFFVVCCSECTIVEFCFTCTEISIAFRWSAPNLTIKARRLHLQQSFSNRAITCRTTDSTIPIDRLVYFPVIMLLNVTLNVGVKVDLHILYNHLRKNRTPRELSWCSYVSHFAEYSVLLLKYQVKWKNNPAAVHRWKICSQNIAHGHMHVLQQTSSLSN